MDIQQKLDILSRDAQYDLSCACGTKNPSEHRKRDGDRWLYPVTTASGGSGIILKTLMSNVCFNDCRYCPLRTNTDTAQRTTITPEEITAKFMEIHCQRREIFGLFLSSGVTGTPDAAMDRLIASAELLRKKYHFRGYIHLKIIPGASYAAIDEAMKYSSAVSLNIEVPGKQHFETLCGSKNYISDVINPIKYIANATARGNRFEGIKTSSQFIVGASNENDSDIIRYSERMYDGLKIGRLYFSAYQSGLGEASIPGEKNPSGTDGLTREHRLYQADYLLRLYGFEYSDFLFDRSGNLSLEHDPKEMWAMNHPELYPMNIFTASADDLMRVPGIGPVWAKRIVYARKTGSLIRLDSLKLPSKALPYLHA